MKVVRGVFWGLIVAWIGLWIYLGSTVPTDEIFRFQVAWPIIFIILGLVTFIEVIAMAARWRKYGSKSGSVGWKIFWGLLFIGIGTVIWLANIGGIIPGLGTLWPFIIVAVGLAIVIRAVFHAFKRKPKGVNEIIDHLEDGKINVDQAVDEIRRSSRKEH